MDLSTSTPATLSTTAAVRLWEERIKDVQSKKATAEVVSRVRAKNEQARAALIYTSQAQRLLRTNMLNCAQSAMALQSFARAAPSPHAYEESAKRSKKHSESISASILRTKQKRRMTSELTAPSYGCAKGAESDDDLQELEKDLSAEQEWMDVEAGGNLSTASTAIRNVFGFAGLSTAQQYLVSAEMSSELTLLLRQLQHEPTDDAEIAAKFLLFENFLANVVAIREETVSFWETTKSQFDGATRTAGDRDVISIDAPDNMSISDDVSKWFVYSMTKQASVNSAKISQILAGFKARLELLSQDIGECPFCLDQMTLDVSQVLGCCHRVCTDCWTNWVELKHEAAFCPLCRHEEFVEEVLL